MMDCQILHMLNNRAKEHFGIGFGAKILTHNFAAVD